MTSISRKSRRVYRNLVYWRVFPAVYGAATAAAGSLLLCVYSHIIIIVAFFTLISIYNMNNLYDIDEDTTNDPGKAGFVRQYRRVVWLVVTVSLTVATLLSALGGALAPTLVVVAFVGGILYSSEITRIKDTFLLNTVLVSTTLSIISVGLPVAFGRTAMDASAVALFGCFLLKFAITVEMCNIPDIMGDRKAGVTTLPIVFGIQRTKIILWFFELVLFIAVFAAVENGTFPAKSVVIFGIPTVYSAGAIYITTQSQSVSEPGIYGDAQLLLIGLLAWGLV